MQVHRRGQSIEEEYRHGGETRLPVTTGGTVDRFRRSDGTHHAEHISPSYEAINEIDLEENAVKMMGPYDPVEPLARLIEQLEKRREFVQAGGKKIPDANMMYKGITLLAQTGVFNDNIP